MTTYSSYDFRMRRMLHSYDSSFNIWFIINYFCGPSDKSAQAQGEA